MLHLEGYQDAIRILFVDLPDVLAIEVYFGMVTVKVYGTEASAIKGKMLLVEREIIYEDFILLPFEFDHVSGLQFIECGLAVDFFLQLDELVAGCFFGVYAIF
jgi:hypothetical protein